MGQGVADTPLAAWLAQRSVVVKSTVLEPGCLVLNPLNHGLAVWLSKCPTFLYSVVPPVQWGNDRPNPCGCPMDEMRGFV